MDRMHVSKKRTIFSFTHLVRLGSTISEIYKQNLSAENVIVPYFKQGIMYGDNRSKQMLSLDNILAVVAEI